MMIRQRKIAAKRREIFAEKRFFFLLLFLREIDRFSFAIFSKKREARYTVVFSLCWL